MVDVYLLSSSKRSPLVRHQWVEIRHEGVSSRAIFGVAVLIFHGENSTDAAAVVVRLQETVGTGTETTADAQLTVGDNILDFFAENTLGFPWRRIGGMRCNRIPI